MTKTKKIIHSNSMAKKKAHVTHKYKHLLVPAAIGAGVAFVASGSAGLALAVAAGVWGGNWVGTKLFKKK